MWTPTDFVVDGGCCDISTIRELLARIGKKSTSKVVILLPYKGNQLLRSLLSVYAEPGALVAENIRRSLLELPLPAFIEFFDLLGGKKSKRIRIPSNLRILQEEPLARLVVETGGRVRLVDITNKQRDFEGRKYKVVLLLIGFHESSRVRIGTRESSDLCTAVFGTPTILFDRIEKTTRRILMPSLGQLSKVRDQYVDWERDLTPFGWLKKLAEHLRGSTRASGVAFYLNSLSKTDPHATCIGKDGEVGFPESIDLRSVHKSIVANVFRRGHIVYLNRQSFVSGASDFSRDKIFQDNEISCIVAIPVWGNPLGDAPFRSPLVAVLANLTSQDREDFSHHTVVAAQQAISYGANIDALLQQIGITAAVSEIIQRTLPSSMRSISPPVTRSSGFKYPSELLSVAPEVEEFVKRVFDKHLPSSITIRLLSFDGKLLRRFWARDEKSLLARNRTLRVDDGDSIQSYVVKTGQMVTIGNCHDSEEVAAVTHGMAKYCDVGRNTKSEVCVPLYLDDRLVGTLNVESHIEDALEPILPAILSLSAIISSSFWYRRRKSEQAIFDCAGALVLGTHSVGKVLDEIQRIREMADLRLRAGDSESPFAHDVQNAMKDCSTLLETAMRLIEHSEMSGESDAGTQIDVPAVINCLRDVSKEGKNRRAKFVFDSRSVESTVATCEGLVLLENQFAAVRAAFHEVSDNARKETEGEAIQIRFAVSSRGGKRYFKVIVGNEHIRALDDAHVTQLFRAPSYFDPGFGEKRARPGLGCFVAGVVLRQAGGDASVVLNSENVFAVALEVPLSPANGGS